MRLHSSVLGWLCGGCLLSVSGQAAQPAEFFTVATYNLENYVDGQNQSRPTKTDTAKAKIREGLRIMKPDVLAVQEIGALPMLQELRASLQRDGLDYPNWEFVTGFDTNICVAVLSRFPIVARRSHTNESFLLNGRRFHTSRGFAEIDVQVNARYRFTLLSAHLKSRREIASADEAELRAQEALRLREIIDGLLTAQPERNLVLLGDFNDTRDMPPLKTLVGKGRFALVDTRPAERNGDNLPATEVYYSPRNITWTHFYGKKDAYERIDYILLSRSMAREWQTNGTYVLSVPNWGAASDHRPIIAAFRAEDR